MPGHAMDTERRDAASLEIEREVARLYRASRTRLKVLAGRFHPELQPVGFGILRYVLANEPLRAGDVVAEFGMDKGAVSRQVTALREMGLLLTEPDPEDGRASLLVASDEARRALEAFKAESGDEYRRILGTWSTDDITTFARLLGHLNDAIG